MTAAAPSPPDAAAVMAQADSENFPVASRLLRRREREHLLAIYGYARLIDDIGDEATGDRGALLDWAEAQVQAIDGDDRYQPEHPALAAMARTARACSIGRDPMLALIAANRRDQVVDRYRDFDDLLGYCRLSAAPVGEMVLHVFDHATPDRLALSERVCAGLQVLEHIQDVGEDRARGRVYLPQDDLARMGCDDADLLAPTASRELRAVLALQAQRARALLDAGVELMRRLPRRPALAIAGFVGGGRAALDALARADHDVLGARPRPSTAAVALSCLRTARERSRDPEPAR